MTLHKLRIVLADDDEDDRLLFQKAIEQIDMFTELTLCKNGIDLITYLRKPETLLPNLLFLDLNMPVKNGIECLRDIKKDPGLKGITVAIYSTSSSEKDINETYLEGANIYINKPTSFAELKKVLKKVLTLDWQYHTSTLDRANFLFRF